MFRLNLIKQLLQSENNLTVFTSPESNFSNNRLENQHWPEFKKVQRRCVVCTSKGLRKRTSVSSTRGLLWKDRVILNHGQVTWTTSELAPPSPNYHTTPTGGRFSSRQIYRASLPYTMVFSGTGLELMTCLPVR
ncbi:hypothetical protein TNCV_2176561 [Trichonephila clavipes]|uniref:Uncharacterized protein n=1 Tax=Trichonephila clavipes TaxID=2585209 RepID=A0A8X7B7F1_TRICX|nr:hypothetical protein TNCV_2176561 [Trichonephila clavipes]